jgi:methylated-DNA-[protein]-cysteine S-methyltransferase
MKHHSAWMAQSHVITPLGPMLVVATSRGLAGAWFEGQAHHPGPLTLPHDADAALFKATQEALSAYFEAPHKAPFKLPLDPQGTAFQQAVWQLLLGVPTGGLTSYGRLAQQLNRPKAARAIGQAVGANPISLLIPCHRVVASDGT